MPTHSGLGQSPAFLEVCIPIQEWHDVTLKIPTYNIHFSFLFMSSLSLQTLDDCIEKDRRDCTSSLLRNMYVTSFCGYDPRCRYINYSNNILSLIWLYRPRDRPLFILPCAFLRFVCLIELHLFCISAVTPCVLGLVGCRSTGVTPFNIQDSTAA